MQASEVGKDANGLRLQPCMGVPWWTGFTPQSMNLPAKHVFSEHSNDVVGTLAALEPAGFHQPQAPLPSLLQEPHASLSSMVQPLGEALQGPTISATQTTSSSGSGCDDDQHLLPPVTGSMMLQSQGDYLPPLPQLDLGQSMGQVCAVYPYTDTLFDGMMAAYGAQVMIPPHMVGVHQARMPLPSDMTEEEPVYVNAKQYNGILRRRRCRAKAESENKLIKTRKPYLHESRHQHAMRRARGCGGRFLNTKKKDELKENTHSDVTGGTSNLEGPISNANGILVESQTENYAMLRGFTSHLMAGPGQSGVGNSGGGSGSYLSGIRVQRGHPIMPSALGDLC